MGIIRAWLAFLAKRKSLLNVAETIHCPASSVSTALSKLPPPPFYHFLTNLG